MIRLFLNHKIIKAFILLVVIAQVGFNSPLLGDILFFEDCPVCQGYRARIERMMDNISAAEERIRAAEAKTGVRTQ